MGFSWTGKTIDIKKPRVCRVRLSALCWVSKPLKQTIIQNDNTVKPAPELYWLSIGAVLGDTTQSHSQRD